MSTDILAVPLDSLTMFSMRSVEVFIMSKVNRAIKVQINIEKTTSRVLKGFPNVFFRVVFRIIFISYLP